MSKKFELLRRNDSHNKIHGNLKTCTGNSNERKPLTLRHPATRSTSTNASTMATMMATKMQPTTTSDQSSVDKRCYERCIALNRSTLSPSSSLSSPLSSKTTNAQIATTSTSNNSFKTFFHRIGSTGMLNRNQCNKQSIICR